jgi:hypothetical protein
VVKHLEQETFDKVIMRASFPGVGMEANAGGEIGGDKAFKADVAAGDKC